MTKEEAKEIFLNRGYIDGIYDGNKWRDACIVISEWLKEEPILDKIQKMKSEIADSLEFWDYSPNNNPLARDILETVTHFWGDIKAESEG